MWILKASPMFVCLLIGLGTGFPEWATAVGTSQAPLILDTLTIGSPRDRPLALTQRCRVSLTQIHPVPQLTLSIYEISQGWKKCYLHSTANGG
jgi:hypothetical protein